MSNASTYGAWRVGPYPDAGEAGGPFHALGDRAPSVGGGWDYDPERAADEAARRARAKVRRYCAANRLNRFGTLTYAGEGEHDPRAVRSDIGRFFRGLRRGLGGEPFPYLWVPELHASGHGWHVHFAAGQFIRRGLIEGTWGRGFVHIKLIGDLPLGTTAREEARVAARYLSKYLGKGFSGGGGRQTRVIPPSLRRLLRRRDQGCTHPGCQIPARWCDAHHLRHWAHGGRTQPDNLRLLCRRHHRLAHGEAPYPQRE